MRWLALLALAGCASAPPAPFPQLHQLEGAKAPPGNLVLNVDPPDAEVSVDGVAQGLGSDFDGVRGALQLSPGPHTLAFRRSGYRTFQTAVVAGDDGRQVLQVALDKE